MKAFLIILTASLCSLPLCADIEVEFPDAKDLDPFALARNNSKPRINGIALEDERAVVVDGLHVGNTCGLISGSTKLHKADAFDKIVKGMTLREIVTALGPASMNAAVSRNHMRWGCEDWRSLVVTSSHNELDKVAEYHIELSGVSQRQDEVEMMVKTLLASFEVKEDQIVISTTEAINDAKAGELKSFKARDSFNNKGLPWIRLTVEKIENGSAQFKYSYRAAQVGLLRYSEMGRVVIREK